MVLDSKKRDSAGGSKMFNWRDQDQVEMLLWNKHKINEDHFLPEPIEEGNILHTFGERSKKQRVEDASNTTSSKIDTSGAKHEFLNCNVEKSFGNSCQDCNDSSLQMDAWSDLHYFNCVLNDGFNDGSDQDSVITELMNNLSDASNLYSEVGIMTGYNNSSDLFPNKVISSLSNPCSLSAGDAMQLDGELEQFGHDDKGNDSFLDYDWANIEDLDDLDIIFTNNDSFDGNEKVHNANSFHNTSANITGNTSQLITADGQSQSWRAREEEKGKGMSFPALNYSYSSEKQSMPSSEVQDSNVNPLHAIQTPPLGLVSFSHYAIFSDYEYHTPLPQVCVESNLNKPINGGFKANLNHSNNHKISNKAAAVVPKDIIMTPRENSEKLKQKQKVQAMPAIQKQCEQYVHQIYSTDDSVSQECLSKNQSQGATTCTDTMEEYKQNQSTTEVSNLKEQYQSQVMSSSINGHSIELAIYHQLQHAMQKLDLRVRLNIRDSLFRLSRSTMERLNASDRSCTDNNKDEDEISMYEESNNHDRSFSVPNSERVTNPIDRIVAHLLFYNSSGFYSLPIGDGNVLLATSM